LTDIHTQRHIKQTQLYWYSLANLNQLANCLCKFKNSGWKIYIMSRGIEEDIVKYLTKLNIIELFDDIYGAKNFSHLGENALSLSRYKTEYLDIIISINNTKKENLYFIDDTEENIIFAKSSGYSNSIHLPNIGISSIMLLSVLEKILMLV
jgi:FMN phosphatase YigB (HAD superfamily)